jgi:hypothetical protein
LFLLNTRTWHPNYLGARGNGAHPFTKNYW